MKVKLQPEREILGISKLTDIQAGLLASEKRSSDSFCSEHFLQNKPGERETAQL